MSMALFVIMMTVNNTWLTRKLEKMENKLILRTIEYEMNVMQLLNAYDVLCAYARAVLEINWSKMVNEYVTYHRYKMRR